MSHRSFTADLTAKEPPTFDLLGHNFTCVAQPPAGVLADVVVASDGNVAVMTGAVVRFLTGCLAEESVAEFQTLIYDRKTVVPLDTLVEITRWLVEEYTGRPTTPSSGSPAGSASTPATPVDGSPSPALTSVV